MTRVTVQRISGMLFVLSLAALAVQKQGCSVPHVLPSQKADAATWVYEKNLHPIPSAVLSGINKLNREHNVVASLFEKDTKDGNDETPEQYKVPLAAAEQAGLPAFVVTAGDKVLNVAKPTTEAEVLEAIQ